MRFVWADFALFDLCILKRPGAETDYEPDVVQAARQQVDRMTTDQLANLTNTILLGLPGSGDAFSLETFQGLLDEYATIGDAELRENLYHFIREVAPVAQEVGVNLCIHPDDPPMPLLGLPRVVSTEADLAQLMNACNLTANGITFCTGSLGVPARQRPARHDSAVWRTNSFCASPHHKTAKPIPRNFHEADHLAGDVDMYAVVKAIVLEQQRRSPAGCWRNFDPDAPRSRPPDAR